MATGNQGKLREYRDLLEPAGFEVVPIEPGIEETGSTYLENAALKAEAAMAATGTPAVGDDSGVEVEALDGFPGLYSARLGKTQPERTAELLGAWSITRGPGGRGSPARSPWPDPERPPGQ